METKDIKPAKRGRRSQLDMTVQHVARLPLDALAQLAVTLRSEYPKVAAFLRDELLEPEGMTGQEASEELARRFKS